MRIGPLATRECLFQYRIPGCLRRAAAVEYSNNFGMGAAKEKVSAERAGEISERSCSPGISLCATSRMKNKENKIEKR